MTDEQLAEYRRRLAGAKVQPDKMNIDYAFHRAWNECLEFSERQLEAVLKAGRNS